MNSWRDWDLRSWNEHLLKHFFGLREDFPTPVVSLLVTAETLARCAGAAQAEAKAVQKTFEDRVVASVRRSGSLLDDAADYEGSLGPPHPARPPRFVAHLLFTCIAASLSSEEMRDEGSFLLRLSKLCDDQLPEASRAKLPRLWENLRTWLAWNKDRYRQLILPDPGGWTRIGYSVKLAFPDRRDQRVLAELLHGAGLAMQDPPPGQVLSLVASHRNEFRDTFKLALDDFHRLYDAAGPNLSVRLGEHRFWAAVREAALYGRSQAAEVDAAARFSLVGDFEYDDLQLFVVADKTVDHPGLDFVDIAEKTFASFDPWPFAVLPKGSQDIATEALRRVTDPLFAGGLRLPSLSARIDEGLLPFVLAPHGHLELASQDQWSEVVVALLRQSLVQDFLQLTGTPPNAVENSHYAGWRVVREPRLKTFTTEELAPTALARVWSLQRNLRPITLRWGDGVRVEGVWLGLREVLPRLRAPTAQSVGLETLDGFRPMQRDDDGKWRLPAQDLQGPQTVAVHADGQEYRRQVHFIAAGGHASVKEASEPSAWYVEHVQGMTTLAETTPFGPEAVEEDQAPLCRRVAYLGRDVGAFVDDPARAAWEVSHFAGKFFGVRGALRGDDAVPTHQVDQAAARRRWRKLLFEAKNIDADASFLEARARIKGSAGLNTQLPKVDLAQRVPQPVPVGLAAPDKAVHRLVAVMAARATARAGVPWQEWKIYGERILQVTPALHARVTRAWIEAGLVDVAIGARWPVTNLFVRPPKLTVFRAGQAFGATLIGLVLANTLEHLCERAEHLGIRHEARSSASPLVPQSVTLRAQDRAQLEELARQCKLPLQWLDLSLLKATSRVRHHGYTPPPGHYDGSVRRTHWSLQPPEAAETAAVKVERHWRQDRPTYWSIRHGEQLRWSYDRNQMRCWAATLLGEAVVRADDASGLYAHHAFLPLPLGRVISVLGGGLAGPTDAGYLYPLGNLRLRALVVTTLARAFAATPATSLSPG